MPVHARVRRELREDVEDGEQLDVIASPLTHDISITGGHRCADSFALVRVEQMLNFGRCA